MYVHSRVAVIFLILMSFTMLADVYGADVQPPDATPTASTQVGSYTCRIIARVTAGQKAIIDGVTVTGVVSDNSQHLALSDNGYVIYCAQTDKGRAIFKDRQVLLYKGEQLSGQPVVDTGLPNDFDVNDNGDVLIVAITRDYKCRIMLNTVDITPQLDAEIIGFPGFVHFTTGGAVAINVTAKTKSGETKDMFLVDGKLQDAAPGINRTLSLYQRSLKGQRKHTGLYWDQLFRTVFPMDVKKYAKYHVFESHEELPPDKEMAGAGGDRLIRNRSGQIALILISPSGTSAVVILTPTNAPTPDTPFSAVLTDQFSEDTSYGLH